MNNYYENTGHSGDLRTYWSQWELESVPHTEWQKGDILVDCYDDNPSYATMFLEQQGKEQSGHYIFAGKCLTWWHKDTTWVPNKDTPQREWLRVKDRERWFEENITNNIGQECPLKRGDLVEVRVGKGKWSLGLWLGLDENWFERNSEPAYVIHLCNKNVREAFGEGQDAYSTWRSDTITANLADKMFRVSNPTWHRPWTGDNQTLTTLDFENNKGTHYNVRWRKH